MKDFGDGSKDDVRNARLPRGAKRLLRIGRADKDVDEELKFHFANAVADLIADGRSEDEARREASLRFGDEEYYRRHLERIDRDSARERASTYRLDAMRMMMLQAIRTLVRTPGLTLAIGVTFALGIGANATMFGIIDRILLRAPYGITNPSRVTHLYFGSYSKQMGKRYTQGTISYPDMVDLRQAKSFSDVAGESSSTLTVGNGETATEVAADMVSDNFFRMLGSTPALGRYFIPGTDALNGPHEAVLGYGYWMRMYGGRSNIIGRTIDFGYGPYNIVGVSPRGFTGVELATVDIFLPIEAAAAQTQGLAWRTGEEGRSWQWLDVFARLAPGVSPGHATAEATAIHKATRAEDVRNGNWGADPSVVIGSLIAAQGPNGSRAAVVAALLAAVSLLVLIIAIVNVANLLVARAIRQKREIAVRLALGISRRRLVLQMLLEGVLLSLLGGLAAAAIAKWGGAVVRGSLLPGVDWDTPDAATRTLTLIAIISVGAGIFSSLLPASQFLSRNLFDTIRESTAGGITRSAARLRSGLVVLQTTLSMLLIVCAGLFVVSFNKARHIDLGWNADGLSYAIPRMNNSSTLTADETYRLYMNGDRLLRQTPGVMSVAESSTMPFRSYRSLKVTAEGVDSLVLPTGSTINAHGVSSNYFSTMQLRILRGRPITDADVIGAPLAVVVNQSMANFLWHGRDPLGKCLYLGHNSDGSRPACSTVVGVSEDGRNRQLQESLSLQYYIALAQTQKLATPSYWFIRLRKTDQRVLHDIRTVLQESDSRIRYADVAMFDDQLRPERQSWELGATMFGLLGALALLVSAIGLYSVLAFDVTQRTREFGLRAALGASRRRLLLTTVRRALQMAASGVVLGGGLALILGSHIQALLFNTSAHDPLVFLAVVTIVITVALIASALPAVRATRIDPNIALRAD